MPWYRRIRAKHSKFQTNYSSVLFRLSA